MSQSIEQSARKAKEKSYYLAVASIDKRNLILNAIASGLVNNENRIMEANQIDLDQAKKDNLNQALQKRLALSPQKIKQMAEGVLGVAALLDPLGKLDMDRELDTGLILKRVSVPIGLIGVIFESRPDAFIQIASLCIKSGNAVILKGGKEAASTNKVLYEVVSEAIEGVEPQLKGSVVLAQTREEIGSLLALDEVIDLMIPRGSNALVKYIKENTRIPVLGHADGICHLYVDDDADIPMAVDLTEDSKCQYPAVCNAIETLLVHRKVAEEFLPLLREKLSHVELRGDATVAKLIECQPADDSDWSTEYNDLILSIKIVDSLEEAIAHINRYGSHHTDLIVTGNESKAESFMQMVDSSSVMWNSSTRFADGFRYGFGAEVGISTNKIHARGPVGLEGLTLYKYRLTGKGDRVRPYADGEKQFTHKDRI
jgi:glutamate-5-semialdehyde dehydrogenase